jgi:oligoendopeptidase F
VNLLSENITKVSPELSESLDYLKKYHLYDFGDEDSRAEGAYLCPIPATRAGYIFIHRSNTADDYESLTHEFGHFNNAYHTYSPGLGRTQHLEVLETHSQGLEMLSSTTLNEVFPDQKGDFTAEVTLAWVQATTSAIMVAAFEIECFRNPDMSLEEMNAMLARYAALTMLGIEVPQTEEDKEAVTSAVWPKIHHLFIAPLYYSSYAFSSLSALDIYSQYIQDPETAVKNYLTLVHVDPDEKYVKAMTSAGLRDMTKDQNIKDVMNVLTEHYQKVLAERITQSLQDGTIGEMLVSTIGGLVGGLGV